MGWCVIIGNYSVCFSNIVNGGIISGSGYLNRKTVALIGQAKKSGVLYWFGLCGVPRFWSSGTIVSCGGIMM